MKQEFRISIKLFAFVMAMIMLIVSLPVYAFAGLISNEAEDASDSKAVEATRDVVVLGEEESLREEGIKHFKLSDGTTKAVIYSHPVHYKDENGNWVDIDNALTLNGNEYTTKNKTEIKLANKSGSSGLVSIKDGEYKIEFTPLNTNKVSVAIENPQKNNSRKFENVKVLSNLISKATYSNIYNGTDIEYILTENNIKENIIVNSKQDSYVYSFELKLNKLTAELTNGSIVLSDSTTGEKMYVIPAPYMYDASNAYSNNVEYTLAQNSKYKYTFTVTADKEWINSEERAFPVTIDPMIATNRASIYDTYVYEGGSNQSSSQYIIVGSDAVMNTPQAYIKATTLPTVNGTIIDAKLSVYLGIDTASKIYIGAFKVTKDFTDGSLTYDTANTYFGSALTPEDYLLVNSAGLYQWNITDTVKSWYQSTGTNHGICLKQVKHTTDTYSVAQFNSADNLNSYPPSLEVTYVDTTGIEDYYGYTQSSSGRAGEGYINTFTGNLSFIHTFFTTADEILPYTLQATYNSNKNSWQLNIDETISAETINGYTHYKWTDSDGTAHWFSPAFTRGESGNLTPCEYDEQGNLVPVTTPTKFYDEDGLGLTVTQSGSNIIISDDQGNIKTFNGGKLRSITDVYGNVRAFNRSGNVTTITLTPNGSSSIEQIKITKSALAYTIENKQTGVIATATLATSTALIQEIQYTFSTNVDPYIVSFDYSGSKLIRAKDETAKIGLEYGYLDNKVKTIVEKASITSDSPVIGRQAILNYATKSTSIRTAGADNILSNDDDVATIHRFDNSGRVITAYTFDTDETIYGASNLEYNDASTSNNVGHKKHNSIKTSFVSGATTSNYLLNGAFNYNTSSWTVTGTVCSVGYPSSDLDYDSTNYGKALKLSSTSATSGSVKQNVYLTAGEYTISSSVFRKDLISNAQATLKVYNSAGTEIAECFTLSAPVNKPTTVLWEKYAKPFTIATAGTYTVSIEYSSTSASSSNVLVDDVMLEKSSGMGSFSAFGNGGFENTTLVGTKKKNATVSTEQKRSGSKSLKLTSNLDNAAYYVQTYYFDGDWNSENMVFSTWVKADAIKSNHAGRTAATFGIRFDAFNSTGALAKKVFIPMNTENSYWQYFSTPLTFLSEDDNGTHQEMLLSKIDIYLIYSHNKGSAYFDEVSLTRCGESTSYEYNELGYISSITDGKGNKTTYNYDENDASKLISTTDKDGKTVNISYEANKKVANGAAYNGVENGNITSGSLVSRNDYGQITSTKVGNSSFSKKSITTTSYVSNTSLASFSKTQSTTDEKGNTTTYYYTSQGLLKGVCHNYEDGVLYEYNEYGELICAAHATYDSDTATLVESNKKSIGYDYDIKHQLTTVYENGSYNLNYDNFGNLIIVNSNGERIVSYTYEEGNGNLTGVTYGYTGYIEYSYDKLDRVTGVCYNGVERASYSYSLNGNIFEVNDLDNATTYQYYYDGKNVLQNVRAIKNGTTYYNTYYGYDDLGRATRKTISFEGVDEKTAGIYFVDYTYNADGLVSSVTTNTSFTNNYAYDDIGRLLSDNIVSGNTTVISNQYGYITGTSGYVTNQIGSVATQIGGNQAIVSYSYDDRGNITSIRKNGVLQYSYEYDGLNQLVRENNLPLGKTYIYTYDGYGNLTRKKTYNYTTYGYGSIAGDEISTDIYTYNDSNQLTSINGGSTITYDEMGNPEEYNNGKYNFRFFWDEVSQPIAITKNGVLMRVKYNQDGVRIEKTMGNYKTEYIVDGTTIIREKQYRKDTNQLIKDTYYYYDARGIVSGANVSVYSGANYTTETNYTFVFKTNIQGDVEAIYNTSGTLLVEFTYDTWGNFTSSLDSMQSIPSSEQLVAEGTSFRYRGYYYDTEAGLYYLNARYYDPVIHRFVNRDDISYLGATGDFNSYNLYAYCSNNPVMYVDPSGNSIIGCLIVLGISLVIGATLAGVDAYNNGERGEELFVSVVKGAAIGLLVGGAVLITGGVGAGVASYVGGTASFLGASAAQAFAWGSLAVNTVSIFVAPFFGIVDGPIMEMPT